MTASMIDPVTDFNCIHPHEVLRLIIPHRVKLLLAYWTRLVSESRVRGSGNVLLLWISSRKGSGQCGFDCRGGSICERSIFGVVARPDPFLAQTSINAQCILGGSHNLPVHRRTNSGSAPFWLTPPYADLSENASLNVGPSFLDLHL